MITSNGYGLGLLLPKHHKVDKFQSIVKQQALAYFKASNYEDCRIPAYPYWRPSIASDYASIINPIAPSIIMIDLDICNYNKDIMLLNQALDDTLKRIKYRLDAIPTVLWSGNGYHIYICIDAFILEDIVDFNIVEHPSTKFLRFAEHYLSDGRSDPSHNHTVSLNNLMMRIPGSVNSKNNEQVQIIRRWDGKRPDMKSLIGSFYAYAMEESIKEKPKHCHHLRISNGNQIDWIEDLLQKPLTDHRKFLVWMVFPQYLMNVRGLTYDESNSIISKWLSQCNRIKSLDIAVKQKLKDGFKASEKRVSAYKSREVENMETRITYSLILQPLRLRLPFPWLPLPPFSSSWRSPLTFVLPSKPLLAVPLTIT